MIKNHFQVAFRHIKKNKLYAILNILGLSIGLGTFFIIYLFVNHELSFDQSHSNRERIYRAIMNDENGYGIEKEGFIPPAIAPAALEVFPEIEAYTRMITEPKSVGSKLTQVRFENTDVLLVDESFFQIFEVQLSKGVGLSKEQPNSVLLSREMALRLFDKIDILNEEVVVGNQTLRVIGVYESLPKTSSFRGELIASVSELSMSAPYLNSWTYAANLQTYFLTNEEVDITELGEKINSLYKPQSIKKEKYITAQSLSDVHFSLDVTDLTVANKIDRQYLSIFTIVGFFILGCAIFNYISLFLSQSLDRTKEIGVRKVSGAHHVELYKQFIIESILNVLFSFICAIVFVELFLPEVEALTGSEMGVGFLAKPRLLLYGLLFSMLIAGCCSVYPAYISTKVKVSTMLNGTRKFSSNRVIGSISTIQLVVFITLICVAFTANRQMHFMRNEKLGFDKEKLLVLDQLSEEAKLKADVLKTKLLSVSGVSVVSYANNLPGDRFFSRIKHSDFDFMINMYKGDAEYFNVMGMTFLEGRGYLPEEPVEDVVVINQTMAKKLGKEGSLVGSTINDGFGVRKVLGVVNDFHSASKKLPVEAMVFSPIKRPRYLIARLEGSGLIQTVDQIKETYSEVVGENASLFFLEDQINGLYKQESIMITIINVFVIIAAIIAAIGLFGVSGYAAKRRLKEIGIRKVLGASFANVQLLLGSANTRKLLLAGMLAMPLVILWMGDWLSSFAYRISMPYELIFLAFGVAVLVMILTMSYHSIKAYLINPVEILKDE